jgi:hypothetical protein
MKGKLATLRYSEASEPGEVAGKVGDFVRVSVPGAIVAVDRGAATSRTPAGGLSLLARAAAR